MATVLDTSALVVFMRRTRRPAVQQVAVAVRETLEAGRALLSAVTAAELLVGARDPGASERLARLIEGLPVVAVDREVGVLAGKLGAVARAAGETIPLSDLLIAATAVWLDVPLLTCDSDFGRGRALAAGGEPGLWSSLRLHPASVI
ncbi:MAG TPA: PIN domain-containing protein [Longimicrobiales bacterium]|nr:PIN domain-containing protein [Longimicrobiales bacterium]